MRVAVPVCDQPAQRTTARLLRDSCEVHEQDGQIGLQEPVRGGGDSPNRWPGWSTPQGPAQPAIEPSRRHRRSGSCHRLISQSPQPDQALLRQGGNTGRAGRDTGQSRNTGPTGWSTAVLVRLTGRGARDVASDRRRHQRAQVFRARAG